MNKFGVQFSSESITALSIRCINDSNDSAGEIEEIRDVLRKFQKGYSEKKIDEINSFMEELFLYSEEISILGTATGEIIIGKEAVKQLLKEDWLYWGDLNIDYKNAYITIDKDVAWISSKGTVNYTFEDTPERYDRYVNYIKENLENTDFTPKQKITFINWVLALNYHQRVDEWREYLWPMCLSAVLIKVNDKWKFGGLQFSMAEANFPDERFENSKIFVDKYNEQMSMINQYNKHKVSNDIEKFIKSFESEFAASEDISEQLVSKYFKGKNMSYVIGPDNHWYIGMKEIKEFFTEGDMKNLSLEIENSMVTNFGEITWVTLFGTLKQQLNEEELIQRSLGELDNLFKSNRTSKDKLFGAHRSIAYVLKECAAGESYTCPIRMTAIVSNSSDRPVFNYIHFSFPFYWVLEGKLDSI